MSSTLTSLRRTYSLARVHHPSPRLVQLHGDYRRLKSAYDRQLAEDADHEVALAMILGDLVPVERQLAEMLQRAEQQPANAPSLRGERAVARASERAPKKRRSAKPRA
jgi:hypothetical protein